MALWRIVVKNSGNAACKDKRQRLEKVWNEMEAKSMYAFQKSHAVCYTWLAYQRAYLKANYPKEFKHVMEKYNTD